MALETRSCGFCGEDMNPDATLCAKCGRFSVATIPQAAEATRSSLIDRLNARIVRREAKSPLAIRLRQGIDLPTPQAALLMRRGAGVAAILLGIFFLSQWLGPRASFFAARFGVGATVAGLALLFFDRIVRPATEVVETGPPTARHTAIRFLGSDTNLATAQLFAMVHFVERAFWQQVDARAAGLAVIALGILLYRSKARLVTISLALAAAVYIIVVTQMMTSFAFTSALRQAEINEGDLVVPLWPIFWILAGAAVFPQFQLIRWGRFRIGAIKGDLVVGKSDNPVLLAFGSAVVLAAVSTTIYAIVQVSNWL
jgi:hypothetical protein